MFVEDGRQRKLTQKDRTRPTQKSGQMVTVETRHDATCFGSLVAGRGGVKIHGQGAVRLRQFLVGLFQQLKFKSSERNNRRACNEGFHNWSGRKDL